MNINPERSLVSCEIDRFTKSENKTYRNLEKYLELSLIKQLDDISKRALEQLESAILKPILRSQVDECSSAISASLNPQIYYMVRSLFQRVIYPESLIKYAASTLELLILPALFSRHVVIRRPHISEYPRIARKLYVDLPEPFFATVANGGLYREDRNTIRCGLVLLDSQRHLKSFNKPDGAMDYSFKLSKKECYIHSLYIHDDMQGEKLGSLLLAAAILDALEMGCQRVCLDSSTDAIGFYASFGFLNEPAEQVQNEGWWQSLNDATRNFIIEETYYDEETGDYSLLMTLDLRKGLEQFKANLLSALYPNQPSSFDRGKVQLPKEAFTSGLLDRAKYENNGSRVS
ncbi:hypothetical protein PHSC3_001824 [Chlamydiales bacterium STE3]|nr:hypothetical protein PHSC3_001824 [Chlamydiales bacterium STE3]